MNPRSRAFASLAGGALLLAPLAGCGGNDEATPAKADPSGTPSVAVTSPGGAVQPASFLTGVTDAMKSRRTVHLKIDGGDLINAEADVEYGADGAAPKLRMTAKFGGQDLRMIVAGKALYLEQGAGGKYLRLGTDDPTFGSALASLSGLGPRDAVTGMESGITRATELGPKTIDGERLDGYRLVVDPKKASGAFTTFAGSAPDELTIDFYVDSDRLPRSISTRVSGQKIAMTLSDWGKPVDITVPSGDALMQTP